MTDAEIDMLMHDLTRPFYILRMAKAKLAIPPYNPRNNGLLKSAEKSAETGRKEIREVLIKHGLLTITEERACDL